MRRNGRSSQSTPHFEEEHSLWELSFVNSQGAEHVINWELASTPEYRQMMSKYKQIEQFMQPPYIVEPMKKDGKGNGEEEPSDAERADLEKAEQKAPKSRQAQARGRDGGEDIRRASSSTTCSTRAARTTPSSATKAWAR